MSKELSPLEVSKQLKDFVLEFVKNNLDRMFVNGSFDIIETALKDYEHFNKLYIRSLNKGFSLEEMEKSLKALEIIREKNVNVFYLKNANSVEIYNIGLDLPKVWQLTKEEFDLLKEVLL